MLGVTAAVLFSLLVLRDTSGRQWSLPSSRVVAPTLLRHDFSIHSGTSNSRPKLHQPPFGLLPTVVGLKGGETVPDNATTEAAPATDQQSAASVAPNTADEISRGGSATAVKRQKEVVGSSHFVAEHEVSLEASSNATAVATSGKNQTKGSKLKNYLAKRKKEKYHKKIAKKLRNRNATNLRRKVMHASFGIFFASLNHFIPKQTFVPGMAVLSSATLLMELLRYRKGFGWMNHALHFVLGKALRKHEMDGKFTGSFYFFTGVTLTAALFPTSSATLGIIQLAIADPSASYFGRKTRHIYWSRIENGLGGIGRNKGFLGFLGGALFCFPFNYRILSLAKFGAEGIPGGKASLALASLALGMAGAFADLAVPTPALTMPKKIWGVRVPPFHLDDNFVVPIVSGFAAKQVFKALGWQQNLELAKFIFV